jgi:hypothetical protein
LLVGAVWHPAAAWLAAVAAAGLLALDRPLWRFFREQRGWFFSLRAVPWQWFSYLYSGLAFAIGLARHSLARSRPDWPLLRLQRRQRSRSRAA